MFWKENRTEFQKNEDIELMSCCILKKLFSFFISSLSLSSSTARQSIFFVAQQFIWLRVFCRWISFVNSVINSLFSLFIFFCKERQIQSRDTQEVLMQEQSWWVHLSHLNHFFNMMKQLRSQKKQNLQRKKTEVLFSWIFFVTLRQFEFFEDIVEWKWFQLYTLAYIDVSELTFKREKMML